MEVGMEQKPPVGVKEVIQVCVVVRNVEQAMENYQRIIGIGPWGGLHLETPSPERHTARKATALQHEGRPG